jgi:GTP-binding protein
VPGLIEGAAEGAGLGVRFLKHLSRTRLLLHLVDIAQLDPAADPAADVRGILRELEKFGGDLAGRERWLVLNKVDLLPADELAARRQLLLDELRWDGPVHCVSALSGEGTQALVYDLMARLEALRAAERAPTAPADEPWDPVST